MRRSVLPIRPAISPRLAISTLLNMGSVLGRVQNHDAGRSGEASPPRRNFHRQQNARRRRRGRKCHDAYLTAQALREAALFWAFCSVVRIMACHLSDNCWVVPAHAPLAAWSSWPERIVATCRALAVRRG